MPEPPNFETFAARLRWWRVEGRKLAHQGKFADMVGLQQGSLSELEHGKSKEPSASVLFKLADALGLNPRYLLLGEGPAEGTHFSNLKGEEAQLVMIYRHLPTDAMRQALLIDANERLARATSQPAKSTADPALRGFSEQEKQLIQTSRSVRQKAAKKKVKSHKKTGKG